MTGKFITFEGGEGSGKSTQCLRLQQFLQERGIKTLLTREPGGSPGGEDIRELLVRGQPGRWDALTEYLLFSASRRDHLINTVWPAIQDNIWVISDRYYHSSLAYQGAGHGLDIQFMENIYHRIAGDFQPDLIIMFDIDPEIGLARTHVRTHTENRFEQMDLAFHHRLRHSFQQQATELNSKALLINAMLPIETITKHITDHVQNHFTLHS